MKSCPCCDFCMSQMLACLSAYTRSAALLDCRCSVTAARSATAQQFQSSVSCRRTHPQPYVNPVPVDPPAARLSMLEPLACAMSSMPMSARAPGAPSACSIATFCQPKTSRPAQTLAAGGQAPLYTCPSRTAGPPCPAWLLAAGLATLLPRTLASRCSATAPVPPTQR